jgi:translation initiation factor 3 subunit M
VGAITRLLSAFCFNSRYPSSELTPSVLERKIRLLTLVSLGTRKIGSDLPYADIASALQIGDNEVETWVIDGLSFGVG